MTTAATLSPSQPLRAVWGPVDVDDVRESINTQKHRWGAFLTARDLLLGRLQAAGATFEQLIERWHLGGVVHLAQRCLGWLLGRHGIARRVLRAGGVRPALAGLLTTTTGRALVAPVVQATASTVSRLTRVALRFSGWVLRLFGRRGQRAAQVLEGRVAAAHAAAVRRLAVVRLVAQVLSEPAGLPMQTVRGWAKARVVGQVLRRLLPGRWSVLARVAAKVLTVPASLRREAAQLVIRGAIRPATDPGDRPTPPAAPAARQTPETDSDEPSRASEASVAQQEAKCAELLDLAEQRTMRSGPRSEADSGSYQRYPAPKRSGTARRKR